MSGDPVPITYSIVINGNTTPFTPTLTQQPDSDTVENVRQILNSMAGPGTPFPTGEALWQWELEAYAEGQLNNGWDLAPGSTPLQGMEADLADYNANLPLQYDDGNNLIVPTPGTINSDGDWIQHKIAVAVLSWQNMGL